MSLHRSQRTPAYRVLRGTSSPLQRELAPRSACVGLGIFSAPNFAREGFSLRRSVRAFSDVFRSVARFHSFTPALINLARRASSSLSVFEAHSFIASLSMPVSLFFLALAQMALEAHGNAGKDRLAVLTSLTGVQVCRRLVELERMGRAKPTGRTVTSTAGRQEREWAVA